MTKRTKSSTSVKLIQAAALAAALVPLGSVAIEGSSITCGFGTGSGGYGGSYCNGGSSSATPTTSRFDFGDYFLELMFTLTPGASFDVTVNTTEMDQTAFEAKAGLFPGYTCLALTAGGPCVDFEVAPSGTVGTDWTHYELEIHWNKIVGQELDPTRMTILHDIGTTGTRDYDDDMCLGGTTLLHDACVINPDPGIRSGDTDFRSFIAAERPVVPEPSTLALLGIGMSGLALRRRRRKADQKPAA